MKSFKKIMEGIARFKTINNVQDLTPEEKQLLLAITGAADLVTLDAYELNLVTELIVKSMNGLLAKIKKAQASA